MAKFNVSGSTLGFTLDEPVGLTPASTHAERVAAYDLLAFTEPAGCIITAPPVITRDWNTGTEEATICNVDGALQQQFKTTRIAPNPTVSGFMDYAEAIMVLLFTAQASGTEVGTYEWTHPNGTDKIWGRVQVKSFTSDSTNVEGRSTFSTEWLYEEWPVFSALVG